MKNAQPLLPLFAKFIKDSERGKRLKKNGERITKNTILNYHYTFKNLVKFSEETGFELKVSDIKKFTQRETQSEKLYWKKFYKSFTEYMYKKGCLSYPIDGDCEVGRPSQS